MLKLSETLAMLALTPIQHQILTLMCKGHSAPKIRADLRICTVWHYIYQARKRNRIQTTYRLIHEFTKQELARK